MRKTFELPQVIARRSDGSPRGDLQHFNIDGCRFLIPQIWADLERDFIALLRITGSSADYQLHCGSFSMNYNSSINNIQAGHPKFFGLIEENSPMLSVGVAAETVIHIKARNLKTKFRFSV